MTFVYFAAAWIALSCVVALWMGAVLRENERPFHDNPPAGALVAEDWR